MSKATNSPSVPSMKAKPVSTWKNRARVPQSSSNISAPVFKRRNNSFSAEIGEKDLLVYYYHETLTKILECTGLKKVQIQNVLAQIDFLLGDCQHECLRYGKLLQHDSKQNLEHILQSTQDVLNRQDKTRAAIKIQSRVRGWLVRKKLKKLKKEDKSVLRIRGSAFTELLRSEKAYMDTIKDLLQEYIRPIRRNVNRSNIGPAAVNYLVGNLENLYGVHQQFYEKLTTIYEHPLYPRILPLGDVICAASAELRTAYMAYVNNYIPRIETLHHLQCTTPKFQAFITEKEQKSESLDELFNLPLQYLLVLAGRLRSIHSCSLPVIENETYTLGRAIGIIESIDLACSKILDEQQESGVFDDIRNTLVVELSIEGLEDPLLGTPNRRLLKDGAVRISKKKNTCQVYLFNDIIIISERMVNSLQHKYIRTIYPNELTIEASGSKIYLHISQNNGNSITEIFNFKNSRSDKSEWILALEEFVTNYLQNSVFGVPLETVIEREQIPGRLPFAMAITMKYIREYGFNTEGIFRVPGDSFVVDTFKRLFDSGATEVDFRGCSIHDVAALLKLYLRKLPEPLIPSEFYSGLVTIQSRFDRDSYETKYVDAIAVVISKLSACNRHVLENLFLFLLELSEHKEKTMMGVGNLAMVFTPNVIRPEEDTVDTAMQSLIVTKMFQYMMTHFDTLLARAIEIDPAVAVKYEWGNTELNLKNLKVLQQSQDSPRYSMDAFDPLLCNEIPLPSTLKYSKGKPQLSLSPSTQNLPKAARKPISNVKDAKKKPKRGFKPKISPRGDEVKLEDSSDIQEVSVEKSGVQSPDGTPVSSPSRSPEFPLKHENSKSGGMSPGTAARKNAGGIILRNERARKKRKRAYKIKYAQDSSSNVVGDATTLNLSSRGSSTSTLWSLISPRMSRKK